jgi:hypothetical protein
MALGSLPALRGSGVRGGGTLLGTWLAAADRMMAAA